MKIVFALYREYDAACEAVADLLARGVKSEDLNAIVLREVRDEQALKLAVAGVAGSPKPARQTLQGLDAMVARQEPMTVHGVGEILAAGNVATIVARTAANPQAGLGLAGALANVSVPEELAREYAENISHGHVLIGVRTADERASEIVSTLRQREGGVTPFVL